MFERTFARAKRAARRRAEARAARLAQDIAAAAPHGIAVEAVEEGARLAGRGLMRRYVLDPALRALISEAKR